MIVLLLEDKHALTGVAPDGRQVAASFFKWNRQRVVACHDDYVAFESEVDGACFQVPRRGIRLIGEDENG